MQRPPPPYSCEYDVNATTRPLPYWDGWNDGQGAGLHLSGLNRTASPASYPQHGFVFQPIGRPFRVMRVRLPSKHDGSSGHMRNAGFRMGAVCGRWHEPVAGQASLCSHGPSAVPHAGTVFAVVAQLVEQRPRNAQVTGPNPVDGSFSTKTDLFFPPLSGWFFSGSLQPDRRGGFR